MEMMGVEFERKIREIFDATEVSTARGGTQKGFMERETWDFFKSLNELTNESFCGYLESRDFRDSNYVSKFGLKVMDEVSLKKMLHYRYSRISPF